MPQLFSRMDDLHWLTPSIADILSQGATPPGGDGSIREQMLTLQKRLSDLETPARIINVRPTPSHTLFIAKPDTVGRLGNRRTVTVNEIKRSLGQISEEQKTWKIGFLPQLQEMPDSVGILLRTDEHKPLSLRRLLVRSAFRDQQSTLTIAIGNTLEQRLIVYDLAEVGNLLIVGSDTTKQYLIHSLLLTLITLNTPGEVRVAIAGQSSAIYRLFTSTPHALGRLLALPQEGQRLLGGLVRELERRRQSFSEAGVESIATYNAALREQGTPILPRIIMLIDSLSDEDWQEARDSLIPGLTSLAEDRGNAGIHLILATDQMQPPDLPGALEESLPVRAVMRSAAGDLADQLKSFHGSLMRFVDAFVLDSDEEITPVETCTVAQEEVHKTIAYWQQASKQRAKETELSQISGKTGVTGVLTSQTSDTPDAGESAAAPSAGAQTSTAVETKPDVSTEATALHQAQALAAYLGWIGIGPLQDILGMSSDDASRILAALRARGVVEDDGSPTPRFILFTDDESSEA
jgi:DNA segregation ATPase FtsK/SpoIIIE, S-DNA-T family